MGDTDALDHRRTGLRGDEVSAALFVPQRELFIAAAIVADFDASNLEFLPPPVPADFINPDTVAFLERSRHFAHGLLAGMGVELLACPVE